MENKTDYQTKEREKLKKLKNYLSDLAKDVLVQFPDISIEFIDMVIKHLDKKNYNVELKIKAFENVLYKCRFTPKLADFMQTKWTADNPKPINERNKQFYK